MHRPLMFSTWLVVAAALPGCTEDPREPAPSTKPTCSLNGCQVCAIATFDGPAYDAHNFFSHDEAKTWLAGFGTALLDHEIAPGPCAATTACPLHADPVCGQLTGGDPETFDNVCELRAATREAAGTAPPGEAKGTMLHGGACEDPCGGKQCGDECPSMFGNPLPTFCDADGACRAGAPVCEPAHDCDLSHVACDAAEPACVQGQTPSVIGVCYGPCVDITTCKCEPGVATQCPEGSVCHANTQRCGPYVN